MKKMSKTGSELIRTSKFWSVDEVAEHLGVPRSWIYDRTRENGPEVIPHLKLGKYIRFNPESRAFQKWLTGHEVSTDVGYANQQSLQLIENKDPN